MISKKKGLRRNLKAFSGRNRKLKPFFRPKTGDLQKKKGLRRNQKAFSGRNQKLKRFCRPKTVTFSSHKSALKSRWGTPKSRWGGRSISMGGRSILMGGRSTRPPSPLQFKYCLLLLAYNQLLICTVAQDKHEWHKIIEICLVHLFR